MGCVGPDRGMRPGVREAHRYDPGRMSPDLPEGDLDHLVARSGIRRVHVLAWRDLDDPEAGGSEMHLHEVCRRWADSDLDVRIRTSAIPPGEDTVVRDGYRVVRRAGRYQVFPRAAAAELARRDGRRDALVEVWNGVPFLSPLWARGPRMVIQHHDHAAMWPLVISSPLLARLGSAIEHRLAPPLYRGTPIVTLSTSSRAELVAGLGHRPGDVHVVPPGVHERFRPGAHRDDDPMILSVGRLTASKRVDELGRAVAAARIDRPAMRLEGGGDGPEEPTRRRLVEELGMGGAVAFRGRISDHDLVAAYQRARVVASASISEGWGMTLTEAAACGTPAVATDIGGHRDAVEDGRSGLLAITDAQLPGLMLEATGPRWNGLSAGALAHAGRFDWDRTATEAFRVLASTVPR